MRLSEGKKATHTIRQLSNGDFSGRNDTILPKMFAMFKEGCSNELLWFRSAAV